MNIRVDLNYPIKDGTEVVFRSPVDCSAVTGLIVYFLGDDGNTASQEFVLADAHGNNVGDIDHLFAENVVVKVILDVTTGMAFVQNADTNAYIERTFVKKDPEESISDLANAVGTGCFAGAKAYQIIDKAPSSGIGGADGYYVLWADALPEENITGFDYSIRTDAAYELCGKIVAIGTPESGLDGIDDEGNHQYGCMTGLKVYVSGYQSSPLIDNTSGSWSEMANTFRIPELPSVGNKDYGMAAWSEGWKTKAIGTAAHAEGWKTKAVGIAAHVEGGKNEAIGEMSHVEGMNNLALGKGSHVEGIHNVAYKDLSHVSGVANISNQPYQTVVGTYNLNKEDTLFEVGVGDVTTGKRANGFEVKKDGSARVLTESTEQDAVVRYSQLDAVALTAGYDEPKADRYTWCDVSNGGENTPEMITQVEMDFEDGSMAGWYDNPATPYSSIPDGNGKAYTTRKIVNSSVLGSKALEIKNFSGADCTYMQQYDLGKSVNKAVLECKFSLYKWSDGQMALYLPTLLYEGATDNNINFGTAPIGLYVQCVGNTPALFYNYGRGIERGKHNLGALVYDHAYTLRVEYDLPTKSVKVFLDGKEKNLNTTDLEDGYDSSIIRDTAKMDRISVGAHSSSLTWAYVDDIKVTVADKNPTNAVGLLTSKKDGEKQYIYPVTKPEAVEGLQDYIVAQGTSGDWIYRKWASGIAECWCTRTLQVNITTACGGAYCSDFLGVDLFPFTFVETPKCFAQVQARNNTVWPVAADVAVNIFPPMYKLVSPIQVSELSATIEHYVVGRWK